jgi:hypothetical protein
VIDWMDFGPRVRVRVRVNRPRNSNPFEVERRPSLRVASAASRSAYQQRRIKSSWRQRLQLSTYCSLRPAPHWHAPPVRTVCDAPRLAAARLRGGSLCASAARRLCRPRHEDAARASAAPRHSPAASRPRRRRRDAVRCAVWALTGCANLCCCGGGSS